MQRKFSIRCPVYVLAQDDRCGEWVHIAFTPEFPGSRSDQPSPAEVEWAGGCKHLRNEWNMDKYEEDVIATLTDILYWEQYDEADRRIDEAKDCEVERLASLHASYDRGYETD